MIQRIATGLGIAAAIFLAWLAYTNRSVTSEEMIALLNGRLQDLQAQMEDGEPAHPDGAKRLAVAYMVGARLRTSEAAEEGTRSAFALARDRSYGLAEEEFTAADRDLLLGRADLRLGLTRFDELGASAQRATLGDGGSLMELMSVTEYLPLDLSKAVDTGDEQAVLAAFEALTQLAHDLLDSPSPMLGLIGTSALSSAFTAAMVVERVNADLHDPAEREAFNARAVERLLEAVPSSAGRQRLITAIELVEDRLPSGRDAIVANFRECIGVLAEGIEREEGTDGLAPGASVAGRWSGDLEALIEWQDGVLATMDRPGFVPSEAAFAEAQDRARKLPSNAGMAASDPWATLTAFSEAKAEAARVKGWIAAGRVK